MSPSSSVDFHTAQLAAQICSVPVGTYPVDQSGFVEVKEKEVRSELVKIERLLAEWARGRKLYGHMYDDVLKLKYLHQRYTNYLKWLVWKG